MEPQLDLRDIHLPEPIGWWPPAPGWWILLFGVPLLVALLLWAWRRWRRMTVKKLAVAELDRIQLGHLAPLEQLRELAILLRRICLSVYPREDVAGLTGEAWLGLLDRTLGDQRFSQGPGRLLLDAPYRKHSELDLGELMALCREWVKRVKQI